MKPFTKRNVKYFSSFLVYFVGMQNDYWRGISINFCGVQGRSPPLLGPGQSHGNLLLSVAVAFICCFCLLARFSRQADALFASAQRA
ncbi:MAG: hypothetical protein HQM04_06935 [Magnetococcales bacterium]|nr:hypothetical protein [Magnetococcales bacterium]MBF0114763.1 hypothetical protein [Magnetococcales bacterium]